MSHKSHAYSDHSDLSMLIYCLSSIKSTACVPKNCMNGGTQDPSTCDCVCPPEYTGELCESEMLSYTHTRTHTHAHTHTHTHAHTHTSTWSVSETVVRTSTLPISLPLTAYCWQELVFLVHQCPLHTVHVISHHLTHFC